MNLFKSFLSRMLRDVILDEVVEKTVPKVYVKIDVQKQTDIIFNELCYYEDLKEKSDEDFYNLLKYKRIKELTPAELKVFKKKFHVVIIHSCLGIYRGQERGVYSSCFVGEVLEKIFEDRKNRTVAPADEVKNEKKLV